MLSPLITLFLVFFLNVLHNKKRVLLEVGPSVSVRLQYLVVIYTYNFTHL